VGSRSRRVHGRSDNRGETKDQQKQQQPEQTVNTKSHPVALDHLAETHEVTNQSTSLDDVNSYLGDTALREGVARHGAAWAEDLLRAHGERCGSAEVIAWGFLANEYKPRYASHDRQGYRIDEVCYHEAYHRLMALGLESGLHARPWTDPGPGAHVARAARYYLQAQVESGHGCPLTMTFAAVPTLRLTPSVGDSWLPKVLNNAYDPRNVPFTQKDAVTIGMGMTEKQGGSDVRANTTRARATGAGGPGGEYELVGHKWFTSAPMCDAFLVLAQSDGGLSCFLVPRWRPDGSKNPIQVAAPEKQDGQRGQCLLRDRTSRGAGLDGRRRGPRRARDHRDGRHDPLRLHDRLRRRTAQAVAQAVNHTLGRSAFGRRLVDQPLMRNVLADLQLELEGSLAMTLRMGEALDRSLAGDGQEALLLRLGLPTGKYWICKRTPQLVYEAMECFGGNGVTEDFIFARLYRDAPINAIWEGSGNVQALDMLRAVRRSPEVLEAFFEELATVRGAHARLDAAVSALQDMLTDRHDIEYRARAIVDRLALTLQGALLLRSGGEAVADAFIRSRLDSSGDRSYGTLPRGVDVQDLIDRANPHEECRSARGCF
jgi:putative acyl-CoA dehydrogenase